MDGNGIELSLHAKSTEPNTFSLIFELIDTDEGSQIVAPMNFDLITGLRYFVAFVMQGSSIGGNMFFGDGKDDHLTIMLDEKLYITELSMPKCFQQEDRCDLG